MLHCPLVFPKHILTPTKYQVQKVYFCHTNFSCVNLETEENLKEIHQGGKPATKTEMGNTLEEVPRDMRLTC